MTRRTVVGFVSVVLIAAALAPTPTAAAGSIVVNSLADAAADDGACSLREAIVAANGDTASGATLGECFAGSGTDVVSFSVAGAIVLTAALPEITTNLSIDGGGTVTVNGADAHAPFTITTGTVTLAGLTITRGVGADYAPRWGGGIWNAGTLTVNDSTITDNYAEEGGGIWNIGTLTVRDSTISLNRGKVTPGGGFGGGVGGGFFVGIGASTTIINSVVTGNSSGGCGGVHGETVTIIDSTISDNHADSGTGGICASTATITRSTVSGNGVYEGRGGISASKLLLVDSTVTRNGNGGISGGVVTVVNSTVTGNTVSREYGSGPGGIWADTLVLRNSIVAGNVGPTGPDIVAAKLDDTASIVGLPPGVAMADILDPDGLQDNGGPTLTIALTDSVRNPAREAADPAICAATPVGGVDQRGEPRPAGACDIGAFELPTPVLRSPFTDTAKSTFRWDIEWLWASGITKGCTATKYCPTDTVTRGQMAAFLDRALALPTTATDYFTDDETSSFEASINRLAASGITRGCTPTTYCPQGTVTRGQMAAFLDRALALPLTTTDYFIDDRTSTFENAINRLARSGITKGCDSRRFCPADPVSRGQMAAFLRRALKE